MIKHIALIPDGNRRWATANGLPSVQGHKYAVETILPQLYDTLLELGISYCTFWAMSPDNFKKRSSFEVNNLFGLLFHFFEAQLKDFKEKNIRVKIIGNLEELPEKVQQHLQRAMEETKHNTRMTFIIAMNYGGRDEVIRGVKKLMESGISSKEVTNEKLNSVLDTADIPDPDIIIRTGGDQRTSGFLLWQSEYTEYFFLDKFFPEFTPEDLKNCIQEYENRQRRFGK
ncbi:MAG TPA: polyprenyl diphosphate synthase [Candidatus Woesebacteria bacterium]|nr:polyprenyl diphosphate synthase [Candidatus Woesebacteria bacterium]